MQKNESKLRGPPAPTKTRANVLANELRLAKEAQSKLVSKEFKLKRFENVESKI